MFRKSYFTFVLIGALFVIGHTSGFAQYAAVSGTVEIEKDGKREPVAAALIEVYRTDIKAGFPSAKTNKKGEFSFAGLPVGAATFVFSISAPGCAPTIYPNVKAGQEKLLITMKAGDGAKWTEAEVRQAVAAGGASSAKPSGELTAEQKKAQAEYEAKVKEIESKNTKAKQSDEIIRKALQEGNDAFAAKNYDLSISRYDEGIQADPNFVGSAPVLLNNRATALTSRGVDTYNKNTKSTDITAKLEAFGKVKADFADAISTLNKSIEIIKNATQADLAASPNAEPNRLAAIRGAKEVIRYTVLTEQVGEGVADLATKLIPDYIAIETDVAKQNEGRLLLADLFRVAGDSEKAIAEYRSLLAIAPANLDALSGIGFSLVNLGYIKNDKTQLQEGANFLLRFSSAAPDTNKFKADAVGLLDILKKEQNVAPVKATPVRKRP